MLTINLNFMSNFFIKLPNDTGQEEILNLQNITLIEKRDSSVSGGDPLFGETQQHYCIYFRDFNENPFIYRTKNKKIRDDFFEAILEKLSLNNNIENTEKEILNSYSSVNKILNKAFLNYKKRLKD